MNFALWLILGLIAGALFVLTAYAIRGQTSQILFWGLVGAALAYVIFAAVAHAGAAWITLELFGVAIYGSIGFLGLRGSLWWLVAGWALHPVWDMALHYYGPGDAFAPSWYAIGCLGWDPVVAATVAYRTLWPGRP
jgi:hypothetical protein